MSQPSILINARLPRWLLGADWPQLSGQPELARLAMGAGRVESVQPMSHPASVTASPGEVWDLAGALVLPGMVDAHVHLDKAFTLSRIPDVKPGLLGAIEASTRDWASWTPGDIAERAGRGLQWAWAAGTTRLRTHVNWADPAVLPMAWPVLDQLALQWSDRVQLELVSLTRLDLFADAQAARQQAAAVAASSARALMGGFVHSTNYSEGALRHLLLAAQAHDLDVDLHVDEELHPQPQGLAATARLLREIGFAGRVVCGHVCALAAMPEAQALGILDEVARAPITLVSLPITNLLLQDAVTGRTPRQRGITLVKEARARGIPLLFASDNVQDPFCRVGSFDPVECLAAATLAAQLDAPFDDWSDTLCRSDWLERTSSVPSLAGHSADLVIFNEADSTSWPSRAASRVVLRQGRPTHGAVPAAWLPAAAI